MSEYIDIICINIEQYALHRVCNCMQRNIIFWENNSIFLVRHMEIYTTTHLIWA